MKQKRKYTALTQDEALDIVRSYHFMDETQQSIANRYGAHVGYITRLVNGEARPDVYAQVRTEEAAAAAGGGA